MHLHVICYFSPRLNETDGKKKKMRFVCVLTSFNATHNQLMTDVVLSLDKTSQVKLTRTTVEGHK